MNIRSWRVNTVTLKDETFQFFMKKGDLGYILGFPGQNIGSSNFLKWTN
jgi:hypothetical protein